MTTNPLFDESPWTFASYLEQRKKSIHEFLGDILDDVSLTITYRWPPIPDPPTPNLPAVRKWIVRRHRGSDGRIPAWSPWTVTAPSGRRQSYATWSVMVALAPYFVLDERFIAAGIKPLGSC